MIVVVASPNPTNPRSAITTIPALSLVRNEKASDEKATVAELRQQFASAAQGVESLAFAHAGDFRSLEQELMRAVWALARVAITLFLAQRHERCVIPLRVERA